MSNWIKVWIVLLVIGFIVAIGVFVVNPGLLSGTGGISGNTGSNTDGKQGGGGNKPPIKTTSSSTSSQAPLPQNASLGITRKNNRQYELYYVDADKSPIVALQMDFVSTIPISQFNPNSKFDAVLENKVNGQNISISLGVLTNKIAASDYSSDGKLLLGTFMASSDAGGSISLTGTENKVAVGKLVGSLPAFSSSF